jgi:H-NS histone family
MHGVDLTAIESVADLHALIDDAHQEIERREAEERDKALDELKALAAKYGKSLEEFLSLSRPAAPAKKSPAKKALPRKKITLEDATASLRAAGPQRTSEGADDLPADVPSES